MRVGDLLALLIPISIAVALLVFLWGLMIFIFKSGDDKAQSEGRNKMIWGSIAIFVMVSIWGLVFFFHQALGLRTYNPPPDNVVDPLEDRSRFGPPVDNV